MSNTRKRNQKRKKARRRSSIQLPLTLALLVAVLIILCFGILPRLFGHSDSTSAASADTAVTAENTADISASSDEDSSDEVSLADTKNVASSAESSDTQSSILSKEEAAAVTLSYPDRVIRQGITIDGVDVSGMTESEAMAQIQADVEEKKAAVITLQGKEDDQKVEVTAGDLGLYWSNPDIIDEIGAYGKASNIIARYKQNKDLEQHGMNFSIQFSVDKDAIDNVITNQCASFNEEAEDATLSRDGSSFTIVPGQTGYVVDTAASADTIYSQLSSGWDGEALTIALTIDVDEPKGTEEELSKVKDLLGTFTTSYSSSGTSRCGNIANGTKLINGHTLYPGDEFSVLNALTPFTEENGYYLAGSYLGGQVVDSFGGGICQVSTTLYNALIRAEIQITERYNHSMIVGYVDPSMDAAIAESSGMDLKFKNNTEHPIYIEGYTSGKTVTFNVYGVETRDAGRKVTFESEVLSKTEPTGQKVYTDASQPVGYIKSQSAHIGYKAQLWKIVTENGKQVSKEVFNTSTYNAEPASITVGTAGTVSAELSAAIAANDVDGVKAALNGTSQSSSNDALTSAAQTAANNAFAAALASGADQATATAAAQAAANQVVASQGGGTSSATTDTTTTTTDTTATDSAAAQAQASTDAAASTDASADAGAADAGAAQ